jgi:UDP-glucose 4-epimerase
VTGAILLLGGSGFIGRALARRLSDDGRRVLILARRDAPSWSSLPNVEYHRGAIDDAVLLRGLLPRSRWVVHLACDSVPGTAGGPVAEAENNLLPSLRVLEWLAEFPAARLLFVSTGGAIYGNAAATPINETSCAAPLSYYASGKASLESFVHAFCHQQGRDAVILRPANVYGPGQPVRPGFGIVPALLHCAATGNAFEVWGDGETVRDFLYIDDFADLCARVIGSSRRGVSMFNVGSGQGCSVNQLRAMVEKVSGARIRELLREARNVDVKRTVLDSGKARIELGWTAQTKLEDGLAETWRWFKDGQR